MELLPKIVIIFIVSIVTCKSQHVSLIGSHQLPVASDYRVFLEAQGLTRDSIVNVTLQSDSDYGESKVFDNVNGDLSEDVGFTLPKNSKSSYRLSIVHRNTATNVCMRQSVIIRNTNICHMIIIQHDRPVYKNGETIKYRTFVLDRNMRPYKYSNMKVSILDGKQNVIKQLDNVQTTEYGVYEGYVRVAEAPNLGVWRIEVEVDGMTRSKHFPVKLHNEKSFEVVIKSMDKEVPFEENYVFLQIQAKSPVNKFFNGIARISSSVRFDGKDEPAITRFIKNVTLPLTKDVLSLRIDNDLGVRSPTADMIATLTVEAFEDRTMHYEHVSVDVPLRTYRNRLYFIRKPEFKPGFDFDMIVRALDLNGELDMSLRQLTMIVDYEEFSDDTHSSSTRKESFVLNFKNGELDVVLHPTEKTKAIKLLFQFGGIEVNLKIPKEETKGVEEYVQATIENKKHLYEPTETLQMTVRSSEGLETLHVLVIGRTGLMYSKSYPEAHGKNTFKFPLTLTEEMSPEVYIVTFYTRATDGVIISDELLIYIRHTATNTLEITPEVQTSRPNEYVKFNLNTTQGSLLYLTAVDRNVTLLAHENQISLSFVSYIVSTYINEQVDNPVHYGKSRISMFVLQPMESGVPCNAREDFEPVRQDDEEDNVHDLLTQGYFPDIWLDETIPIKNDEVQSIQRKVPNDLTSWLIYGTSMHPTNSLAFTKQEAIVYVYNDLAVKLHTPDTVQHGEVLKVELSVFNYLKTSQTVQYAVTIENGDTMDEKSSTVSGKPCKTYVRRNKPSVTLSQQVTANSLSTVQFLYVQPNTVGEMRITVRATGANGVVDVTERRIEVRDRRNLKHSVVETALVDGPVDKTVRMTVPENRKLLNAYAMFSGSLLGPVVNNLDLFENVPMDYREPKSNEFMLSMIVGEYYEGRKEKIPVEVMDRILMGYQETLESLQNEDKSTKWQKSSLFYVYATFSLIKAKTFIDIDDRVIEIALDYLVTKQGPDGSFMDGPEGVDLGQMSSQRHILTAQFTLAFVKYQKYSNKYDDVITRAMKFLDTTKTQLTTDYEKVLVAYTFSANGDQATSKLLISSLKCTFANSPDFREETSLYVGIASFLIELKILDGEDPKLEVEWMLNQRKPNGMFFSPHDTLSAMHALLTYELSRNSDGVNWHVTIDGQNIDVTDMKEIKTLQLRQNDRYTLRVTGTGLGYATIYYEYVEKEETVQTEYLTNLDVRETGTDTIKLTLDVKQVNAHIKTPNLVIVEVEMPSGYEYYNHVDGDHIKQVEYLKDRSTVIFFLDITESNRFYKVVVQAVRVYRIEYPAESVVRVYDFYRPNVREEVEYFYDVNMVNCKKRGTQTTVDNDTDQKGGIWNIFG